MRGLSGKQEHWVTSRLKTSAGRKQVEKNISKFSLSQSRSILQQALAHIDLLEHELAIERRKSKASNAEVQQVPE